MNLAVLGRPVLMVWHLFPNEIQFWLFNPKDFVAKIVAHDWQIEEDN